MLTLSLLFAKVILTGTLGHAQFLAVPQGESGMGGAYPSGSYIYPPLTPTQVNDRRWRTEMCIQSANLLGKTPQQLRDLSDKELKDIKKNSKSEQIIILSRLMNGFANEALPAPEVMNAVFASIIGGDSGHAKTLLQKAEKECKLAIKKIQKTQKEEAWLPSAEYFCGWYKTAYQDMNRFTAFVNGQYEHMKMVNEEKIAEKKDYADLIKELKEELRNHEKEYVSLKNPEERAEAIAEIIRTSSSLQSEIEKRSFIELRALSNCITGPIDPKAPSACPLCQGDKPISR